MNLGLEFLSPKQKEIKLSGNLFCGGTVHDVKIVISEPDKLNMASFASAVLNLDQQYKAIIDMANTWFNEYVKWSGDPEEAPLSDPHSINASKGFRIKQIDFIPPWKKISFPGDKPFVCDAIVFFLCDNECDRGMEAMFFNGKLVAVEMAQ